VNGGPAAVAGLRIATLNLQRGGGRRVTVREVLRDTRAEVLFVQEAPSLDALPAAWLWRAAGTRAWGSGIAVTHGLLEARSVPGFDGWATAARWHRPAAPPLLLLSVHVPAGRGGYAGSLGRLLDAIGTSDRDRMVLAGDFNVCISDRLHTGEGARRGERRLQARLRDEFGLVSCWDALHPRGRPPQTLRWSGAPEVAYHCDGLFVPAAWCPWLARCRVLASPRWRRRSDHNPVVATFGPAAPAVDAAVQAR
jgi:endonuclease/exonuclease/phosphatase family metal-dependent hydrolase